MIKYAYALGSLVGARKNSKKLKGGEENGMLITVDCGSTNMRCRLFDKGHLADEVKKKVGTRDTAFDGTSARLRVALGECIKELSERNGLAERDIEAVISAGTLSSDVGIYRVPHVLAPVGIAETASHAEAVVLRDITSIPILFIPGVRTYPTPDTEDSERVIECIDSMSGEECETYGIMSLLGISGDFIITLPGSYTKTFYVDGEGRITNILTGMCGEFIAAMSEHTLLRHSLPIPPIQRLIPEKLTEGFDYCAHHGVSPSLIKARNLRVWANWNEDEAANFFVGAILLDDIRLTLGMYEKGKRVIVGGSSPLRDVFEVLLVHAGVRREDMTVIDDEVARLSSNTGAIKVYEMFKANSGIEPKG